MDLASADTLGNLAPEFQAGLWPGFGWLFHAPWLLALGGLLLFIFRTGPAKPVPWLKVFVFAVLAALFGQTALGLLPQMHYAAFVLPWGVLLAGLCPGPHG